MRRFEEPLKFLKAFKVKDFEGLGKLFESHLKRFESGLQGGMYGVRKVFNGV